MSKNTARWIVRTLAFCASLWLVLAGTLLPRFSPLSALLALLTGAATTFALLSLPVAAVSFFFPRFFCRWLCPTGFCQSLHLPLHLGKWTSRIPSLGFLLLGISLGGAALGFPFFAWLDPLTLFQSLWGAGALAVLALIAPGFWCAKLCPLGALQDLATAVRTPKRLAYSPARRFFIGATLGASARALLPKRKHAAKSLRPPGTKSDAHFYARCARCGICAKVCPSGVIVQDAPFLAPRMDFENNSCAASCSTCAAHCPTGAIGKFRFGEEGTLPSGIATVDDSLCRAANGMECGHCFGACPFGALDYRWDADEMCSRVSVKRDACAGCGACEYACPQTPKAIYVKPVEG